MNYATVDDVKLAYEAPIPAEIEPRVIYLLEVASARLTALIPSLPGRINQAGLWTLARDVVVRAVMRALRNPSETMTTSQVAGPYSTTVSYGAVAAANNRSMFDDTDLALLAPPVPVGLRSVQVGIPRWRLP